MAKLSELDKAFAEGQLSVINEILITINRMRENALLRADLFAQQQSADLLNKEIGSLNKEIARLKEPPAEEPPQTGTDNSSQGK